MWRGGARDEGFTEGAEWEKRGGAEKGVGWVEGGAEQSSYFTIYKSGGGCLFIFNRKIKKLKLENIKARRKSLDPLAPACRMAFNFLFLVLIRSEFRVPGLGPRACATSGIPGTRRPRPECVARLICIQSVYVM